jgi:hypothetical protein
MLQLQERSDRSTNVLQDYEYLSPIIKEIEAAAKERADLESMKVQRK